MAKGKYGPWLEPDGLLKLEGYARDGMVDADIAKTIGIASSTLYEWMDRFPVIAEAIKRGKAPVDTAVENALLKRALGYELTEETRELRKDPETGMQELMVTKRVTKHVPPDTTAQIFWLKNRKPEAWRDKHASEQDESKQGTHVRVTFDLGDGEGEADGD